MMAEILRGVRVGDGVLTGILTAVGVGLMVENVLVDDTDWAQAVATGDAYHVNDTHSLWLIPLFVVATLPVLWWRRSALAVTGVCLVAVVLHDVVFGWATRCGAGLPLAYVLTFLGALAYDRSKAWWNLALTALLVLAVLAVDSSAGPPATPLALPVLLVVFLVGRAARHRGLLREQLQVRDEELRRLRDERAALTVADDRARLSQQLDGLLQQRLDQLTAAAESAGELPPEQARALLETIETDSRATMDDMREIVGLLRGGELVLAPAPTVAHLSALLARHRTGRARLTVTGDPRSLPATVELSAFRIVEYLVAAVDEHVEVAIEFADEALEIRVHGAVDKGGRFKAAVARARERAALLGGRLDADVTRGRARVLAQLPVVG